jgi:hypothetical protein
MKKILPLLLILLSGCTVLPKYNYQSQANIDPEIVFGDRFGGGTVTSPARTFKINTKDVAVHRFHRGRNHIESLDGGSSADCEYQSPCRNDCVNCWLIFIEHWV